MMWHADEPQKKPLRYRIAFGIAILGWLYGLSVVIYRDLPTYDKLAMTALIVGSALVWYMDNHDN